VDRGAIPGKYRPVQNRPPPTILLIDDYAPNLTAMEAALEPLEHRVVKARSGSEALKFLLSEEGCALILLDVNMPGHDGFETANLIRSRPRTREIPILFVTAASRPEGARLASEYGAADYIVRPIEPEALRTKVRTIIELRERAEHLEQQLLRTAENERTQLVAERRLERRYRSLVEATGQVVFSMGPRGEVMEDSPSWRAFTGQTAEELVEGGFLEAVHPEDRERARRAWQAGPEKLPYDVEFRLRRADGSYAEVLSRGVPVLDDDGTVLEWLGTCIDLTDHKRADEEVRASRDQLDVILGSVSEGITAQDAIGRLVFANDEAARMGGFASGSEMLAAGVGAVVERFDVRDEAGGPFPTERLPSRLALRTGSCSQALLRVRRKGADDDRRILVRSMPVQGPSGKATLVINVMQDVTESRRAALAAQLLSDAGRVLGSSLEADATLAGIARLVVPRLADFCAVHLRQPDGSIKLLALAGLDASDRRDAGESTARHPIDPVAAHGVAAVLRSGKTQWERSVPDALLVERADGPAHLQELRAAGLLSYIAAPLCARGQVLGALTLVTTARSSRQYDASDVRTAEELAERVAAAQDNAALYKREQEAVHARDDFLSIASHELRTPLTPLRLQIQILRRMLTNRGALARDKLAGSLDTLERQTERLGRLVSDLLDVSRITAGKLTLHRERLDLADLAREVVERYAGASGSRIDLQTESAAGHWDRARLEQVATNLLANAIKYGQGKPIDVSVGLKEGIALLAVRDRGIGIAAADVERIFGRFERAASASSYGGLGLGLYIAQQITAAHGGRISVESAPGQGATFTVALPPGEP
jgi:PAS domain S-box-containing protein